ncbi:TetR/AcrR family transcriptional regulator [Cupriavidus lacunae]|nr:TetR/AcrR family transcriptional regulator [Cupriavidus lacunae]
MNATVKSPAPSHRERLLKEGLRSFYATGFHGTSVDELLAAAEAPKGSFYHHFGSKDEFAKAVIAEYSAAQMALLDKFASREDLTAYQKIIAYFETLLGRFERSQHKVGCLVGKFSTELAPSSDAFSAILAESMKDWRAGLAKITQEGHRDGSIRTDMPAGQQAVLLLSLIQGSLVVALAERNHDSLTAVRASLPKLLSARYGTPSRATAGK